MLRLSIFACAVIYIGLTIMPERGTPTPRDPAMQNGAGSHAKAAQDTGFDDFLTADGRSLSIAAVITPSAATPTQGEVPRIVTPMMARYVAPPIAAAAVAPRDLPLAEVTGTRVNLRAGPSTNDPVLTALRLGDQVALIGATGDGWAQIRALEGGAEGFMAIRFLTPLN